MQLAGLILDVDGVIWNSGAPSEGANALLTALIEKHIPFCLLTNDASTTFGHRCKCLQDAGLPVSPSCLITAPIVTRQYLIANRFQKILYFDNVRLR